MPAGYHELCKEKMKLVDEPAILESVIDSINKTLGRQDGFDNEQIYEKLQQVTSSADIKKTFLGEALAKTNIGKS